MSSYNSTGSYFSAMDDASTTSSTTTSRTRSNSLFENPTGAMGAAEGRRRSNSLFENPSDSRPNSSRTFVASPTPHHPRRVSGISNSVVQSMITSNNLRNCREVEEMVVSCLNNKDNDSFICKTAQRYIGGCQK